MESCFSLYRVPKRFGKRSVERLQRLGWDSDHLCVKIYGAGLPGECLCILFVEGKPRKRLRGSEAEIWDSGEAIREVEGTRCGDLIEHLATAAWLSGTAAHVGSPHPNNLALSVYVQYLDISRDCIISKMNLDRNTPQERRNLSESTR